MIWNVIRVLVLIWIKLLLMIMIIMAVVIKLLLLLLLVIVVARWRRVKRLLVMIHEGHVLVERVRTEALELGLVLTQLVHEARVGSDLGSTRLDIRVGRV